VFALRGKSPAPAPLLRAMRELAAAKKKLDKPDAVRRQMPFAGVLPRMTASGLCHMQCGASSPTQYAQGLQDLLANETN
jgi:hypothetical protein